jgi:hypothetical protein
VPGFSDFLPGQRGADSRLPQRIPAQFGSDSCGFQLKGSMGKQAVGLFYTETKTNPNLDSSTPI